MSAVRVHFVSLAPTPARLAAASAVLSTEEAARAARFRFARDRDAFVLSHGALRHLLGSCLGVAPGDVAFGVHADGKPFLRGTDLTFNLSHAHGVAAVAVARGVEVGVDVERVRTDLPLEEMAGRFFSRRESEWIAALPRPARVGAFFTVWTRKEAYLKAIGKGLALPLDAFAVGTGPGPGPHPLDALRGAEPHPLTLWAIDAPPGYAAALVVLAAGAPRPRLFGRRFAGLRQEDEHGERRVVPRGPGAADGRHAAEPAERKA